MKRILYLISIASFALVLTAGGQQINDTTSVKSKAKTRGTTVQSTTRSAGSVSNTRQAKTQRYLASAPFPQRTYIAPPRPNSSVVVNRSSFRSTGVQTFRESGARSANEFRSRNNVEIDRERNFAVNRLGNLDVGRKRNLKINSDRNVTINRDRNVTINNNWRGERFSGRPYAAFRNYHREWHDRAWWRSHHTTIIFVSGGWYYWDAGYWFPAWGYDPYCYYPYDGPIYGYNGLAPDQVVADVQVQLQRDGYYTGPIDGILGPMTRQAIAAFQADHGLAITSAIDEPTLATLGLT
jgi:hypothetical protein